MNEREAETTFSIGQRWKVPHTPLWLRLLAIGLVVLLLLWIVSLALKHGAQPQTGSRRYGFGGAVPVGVASVEKGDVKVTVDGLGTVTPLATVTVHPEVTGYLLRFDVKEGQMVKAGQLLAEIDPRPFQAALDQARGQLARDQALLANAKIDLVRYQQLWKANAVSQQILQTQIATVGTDVGTVAADQAAVEAARVNLLFCRITSPVAGRVGLRQVDPGNLVVSGGATAIIVVTELQPMSIIFSLPEDTIDQVMRRVRAGDKLSAVAYDRAMTGEIATGYLSNVDNVVDPTTGMVKMRAMFDNSDNALFPSQFVNIRLLLDTLHDQPYVPTAAIQHGAEGSYVYVVDKDMTAGMRTVKTGPTDGDKVAITEGLAPGERVVIDGADRLRDGARVTIPGTSGGAQASAAAPSNDQETTPARPGGRHGHGHHHHWGGGDNGGGQGGNP